MPKYVSIKVVLDYIFYIIMLLEHNGDVSPENALFILVRERERERKVFHKLQRTVADIE